MASTFFACAPRQEPAAPVGGRAAPQPYVDVEAKNLDAAAELDALLKGEPGLGIANALRIAAPPWVLLGGGKETWLGEAAAELVAARLSGHEATSVVQRGELLDLLVALKKAQGETSTQVIDKGKLLGAQLIVTGTLMPQGDGYLGVLKAVRVTDGTLLPAVKFQVQSGEIAAAVTSATGQLATHIGFERNPAPPPALSRQAAELAARARQLQFSGRLSEAQALYQKALDKPSSAFRYEADYLGLMNDLGMTEWVEERGKSVLASMPRTGPNVCPRAQILIELARMNENEPVKSARDAVRAAASCGDPTVLTRALTTYGWSMGKTHFPSAKVAYDHAAKLAAGGNEIMRCEAEFQKYYWSVQGVDVGGVPEKRWLEVARRCRNAGNVRAASIATRNAAGEAWSPKQRVNLRKQAVALAKVVGGSELDEARRALARDLRDEGRPSEADELILEAIGSRVRALQALEGGAADPEARLDRDLLKRAKATPQGAATRTLDEGDQLLAKAHRTALARLIDDWATRTEAESVSQAAVYRSIQKALDPPKPERDLEGLEGAPRHEKRLAIAKLPLSTIEKLDAPPLRGEAVNMRGALLALWEWYFLLREQGADVAMRKRLVASAKKVAAWQAEPGWKFDVLRLEAHLVADEGNLKESGAILRSAREQLIDAPARSSALATDAVRLHSSAEPKTAIAAARERVGFAKRVSPDEWTSAVSLLGEKAVGHEPAAVSEANQELERLAKQFESDGLFEASARALEALARLDMIAGHAEGTLQAVEYYRARAKVLERLSDPLRTLQARADVLKQRKAYFSQVYRGGAQGALEKDPSIVEESRIFAQEVENLQKSGRTRDAIRLVISVPASRHIEQLLARALGWAEELTDSKEHPLLVGRLYAMQAGLAKTRAERQSLLGRSREAYKKGGNIDEAVWQAQRLVNAAVGEAEVHDFVSECLAIAEKKPATRLDCLDGLSQYLYRSGAKVTDRARYGKYLSVALENLPLVDKSYVARVRYTHRTRVAMIAAIVGDLGTVKRLDREVRDYYTKAAPNRYELVIHLNQLGRVLDARDPQLATELYLAFEEARGASDWWRAEAFFEFADAARRAGNSSAETLFIERGRQSALPFPVYYYHYEIHPARAAIAKRAWRDAEKVYAAALAKLEKLGASHESAQHRVALGLALSRVGKKDEDGAMRALKPFLGQVADLQKRGQSPNYPCFARQVLEVAAAIESKRGACKRFEELKRLASDVGSRCQSATCTEPISSTVWCDSADDHSYRAPQECKGAFSPTPELFPQ